MSITINNVEMTTRAYINDYYDTNACITSESDPAAEYALWLEYCAAGNDDASLLSEQDFADYINQL